MCFGWVNGLVIKKIRSAYNVFHHLAGHMDDALTPTSPRFATNAMSDATTSFRSCFLCWLSEFAATSEFR